MRKPAALIGVELDATRALCVVASSPPLSGGRLVVRSIFVVKRPEGVDPSNAGAVGKWLREALQAKRGKGSVCIAAGRGEVVLKRLTMPLPPGGDEGDLAGAVALQMARQAAVPMEASVVDYASVESPGADRASVLAAALPGERMGFYRDLCAGAGLTLARVGLRCSGAAALAAEASQKRTGALLVVAPGWSATEFVVVQGGHMVFARSADIGLPEDESELPSIADRLGVEAKRTWMTYRASPESGEIEAVCVVSGGPASEAIGARCAASLEMPMERLAWPDARVEIKAEADASLSLSAAPLIGLLAEASLATRSLNFAHPRRAPDRSARARQMALLGVLALIVVIGGVIVLGMLDLDQARSRVQAARDQESALRKQQAAMLLEDARLRHLQAWSASRVDWLAHFSHLVGQLPKAGDARLDELRADMTGEVRFDAPERSYTRGRWVSSRSARFVLAGNAKSRAIADGLRESLLSGGVYQVDSRGPDVSDAFDLVLTTSLATPETPRKSEPTPKPEGAK